MKATITIFLVLIFAGFATAQVNLQNTGTVYISNTSDTLFINGSFTNASGSAFTNNGILYVKQDISNDQASMTAGTGRLYLNGSALQTISGTQTFKTFDLFTNNAAGFTLNNNLSVSGAHTYTAGMITTSSTPNYMIYEAGSSYTGSDDSKHVNGWVKKIGSTGFTFPVGNASYERPVALSNLTASSEFDVKHTTALTPNRFSLYTPIVIVDSNEYWTINRVSGTASAQVTMNWNTSQIPFPVLQLSHLRATYYDGTFWKNIGGSATGSVLTTGSITSTSTNAFNTNFTIGSISLILPVKLISFNAGRINGNTKLDWVIGNEINIVKYELERSDNGFSFYNISVQYPANNNGTEFYNYTDRNILSGTAYYRLKITGADNGTAYSRTVAVSENNAGKKLYVIRNPVDESIDLYAGTSATGTYTYSITTTSGQLMQTGTINIGQSGSHSIRLQSAFAAGSYVLVMKGNTVSLQKLIIKK